MNVRIEMGAQEVRKVLTDHFRKSIPGLSEIKLVKINYGNNEHCDLHMLTFEVTIQEQKEGE